MSTGTLTGPRPGTTSTRPASRDHGHAPSRGPDHARRRSRPPRTTARRAPRGTAPFVLLIMVLLTGGLVATLWLSTAAAADSYRLDEARQVARDLSEQSERLHRDVEAAQSAPALAAAARAQGMVPGGGARGAAGRARRVVAGHRRPAARAGGRPAAAVAVPATPPAATGPPAPTDGAQNNGAQAATDGQPAPAPAGAAAAEDQLVAVPETTPDTTPDPTNSETTPDSAAAADDASPAAP